MPGQGALDPTTSAWTVAVSAGLSLRAWPAASGGAAQLLWHEPARAECVGAGGGGGGGGGGKGESKFSLALDGEGRPLANDVRDDAVSVYVYNLAEGGGGVPPPPFRMVVVVEERRQRRWVGGPRRPCHARTAFASKGAAAAAAERAGASYVLGSAGSAVLVLGLRDCRTDAKRPPFELTKAMLLSLVSRASPGHQPLLDASASVLDLTSRA